MEGGREGRQKRQEGRWRDEHKTNKKGCGGEGGFGGTHEYTHIVVNHEYIRKA